jgi:hypothetical protein
MTDYLKEKYECECGAVLCRGQKRFHIKTKQHLQCIENGISKSEYLENKKLQNKNEIIECECGVKYKRNNKGHHKTKTHLNYINTGETKQTRMDKNVLKRTDKIMCDCCKVFYIRKHKSKHEKSLKHINNISTDRQPSPETLN